MYRLVISEKTKDPYGRALEILGTYNPFSKEVKVKEDRIKHWLSKGAGMSATVNNLLINNKIIEGKKEKSFYPKKKKESPADAKASPSAKATEDKPGEKKAEVKPKEEAKSETKKEKTENKPEVKAEAKEEPRPEVKKEKAEEKKE